MIIMYKLSLLTYWIAKTPHPRRCGFRIFWPGAWLFQNCSGRCDAGEAGAGRVGASERFRQAPGNADRAFVPAYACRMGERPRRPGILGALVQ